MGGGGEKGAEILPSICKKCNTEICLYSILRLAKGASISLKALAGEEEEKKQRPEKKTSSFIQTSVFYYMMNYTVTDPKQALSITETTGCRTTGCRLG